MADMIGIKTQNNDIIKSMAEKVVIIEKAGIITNKIQCAVCNDIIESKYNHDFVRCKCGQVAVDGGRYYLKRIGPKNSWKELSTSNQFSIPNQEDLNKNIRPYPGIDKINHPKSKDPIDELINKIKNL